MPGSEDRRRQLAHDLADFVRSYARKRGVGASRDPNDRSYDRRLQRLTRKMDPAELDALLNDDVDEPDSEAN